MDKRIFIALLLTAAVVAITPILFPVRDTRPRPTAGAPASQDRAPMAPARGTTADTLEDSIPPGLAARPAGGTADAVTEQPPQVSTVKTRAGAYQLSSRGAAPVRVTMLGYPDLARNAGAVELDPGGNPILRYRLVTAGDTVDLSRLNFTEQVSDAPGGRSVVHYTGTADGMRVSVRYSLPPDGYIVPVEMSIEGNTSPVFLLVDLPTTLRSFERDTVADLRSLSYVFKPRRDNATSVAFGKLEPGERELQPGPLTWAAVKNKYFVIGLLSPEGDAFDEASVAGGPRTSRIPTNASATIVKAVSGGRVRFDVYAGPQQSRSLASAGREFINVNPYGWKFLQGMVQPIAALCLELLLWMHQVLKLSYGWVLIIFGVLIRIALWPLNQSAMRSSLKMQEIQPKLQEVQRKYKDKPERQREEMMRVYREAGASPFSAISGCLPALIPMPVLIALFFVFQNTIEFRGVPFLWLEDISLKDPYYIIPLLMGVSMYVLSWIGLRNAPPNPQAKIMAYMFPVMMTFVLANMASGLNLYYTSQNVAALPQQWLLARERARARRSTG